MEPKKLKLIARRLQFDKAAAGVHTVTRRIRLGEIIRISWETPPQILLESE
jgi:hypothetical protein